MRQGIEAMNRRDIDGALQVMDPEVRFEHRLAALEGSFVGVEGVKGWFENLLQHFDSWRIDCPDIRDLGGEVLALGTVHATGTESGVETELPFTVVARIEGGRVTQFIDYGDRDAALAAVGLSR